MKRLLVPLDGSLASETALGLAVDLARWLPAEILVLRVLEPAGAMPAGAAGMVRAMRLADEDQADEYLERTARLLTQRGVRGSVRCRRGNPVSQILRTAREEQVDLVVISSHGRSGPGRWLLGSVTENVLRQSPIPVLIARGRTAEFKNGFGRVVVPVEGAPAGWDGFERVQRYLAPGARVCLVRATDPVVRHSALSSSKDRYENYVKALQTEMEQHDPDGRCHKRVLDCPPAEAILTVAEEEEADLIAMSTHGRRGFDRLVGGSVTERVARHAPCPVLAFPKKLRTPAESSPT